MKIISFEEFANKACRNLEDQEKGHKRPRNYKPYGIDYFLFSMLKKGQLAIFAGHTNSILEEIILRTTMIYAVKNLIPTAFVTFDKSSVHRIKQMWSLEAVGCSYGFCEETRLGKEWIIIDTIMGKSKEIPLFFADYAQNSIMEIREWLRQIIHSHKDISLLIIDNLHALITKGKDEACLVYELQKLAKTIDIPIVAASYLPMTIKPTWIDILKNDCGEKYADILALVPDYPGTSYEVVKNRDGLTGTLSLSYKTGNIELVNNEQATNQPIQE